MRKNLLVYTIVAALLVVLVYKFIYNRNTGASGNDANITESSPVAATGTQNDTGSDTAGGSGDTEAGLPGFDNTSNSGTGTESGIAETSEEGEKLLRSEEIKVDGNSAEYELKALLCEDISKNTFLRLEYYLDGESRINEFSDTEINELKDIFENRASGSTSGSTLRYRIGQMVLNSKYSRLYMTVTGEASDEFCNTSVYCLDLKDLSAKKLTAANGEVGRMMLNKTSGYIAYSYYNPPFNAAHNESYLLDIIDCDTNDFVVRYSRDENGKPIGSNAVPEVVYNFELSSWKTDRIVLLKLTETVPGEKVSTEGKKPEDKKSEDKKAIDVLYDIGRNLLLNTDGTALKASPASGTKTENQSEQTQSSQQAGGSQQTGSSQPAATESSITEDDYDSYLNALKTFYSYLAAEKDYIKAMEMLDEGFYLEIGILKMFEVEKITKEDINTEEASFYSDILRAAKFDMLVKVEIEEATAQIYYYHTISLDQETQLRQALIAQIKKSGQGYKIMFIKDADTSKTPFTFSWRVFPDGLFCTIQEPNSLFV